MNERTLTIGETSVHLRESSGTDASLPALLCLHGNLGSGRWFTHLLDAYPGQAYAPDMPNFGGSDHIQEHTMAAYARSVKAICDAIGTERVVVLGHSLGGAVAMELLASYPELVQQLILVDSSPIDGLVTPTEYHPAIEAYKSDKSILAQALKTVVPTLKDEAYFSQLVDDAWKMNRDCFIGHAEELGKADFRTRLQGASVPVCVMRGALDALITEERANTLAEFFGGTVYTFETCGHSPMVELQQEFALKVVAVIREAA